MWALGCLDTLVEHHLKIHREDPGTELMQFAATSRNVGDLHTC